MQPSLSLAYNSQGGNGLLGMGWAIGGLSTIHRCGATIEVDGFKGGVNYDANDRLCLDGERLIAIGGNQYRTQRESLQKIEAIGGAANPNYFLITDHNGTVREYGGMSHARIERAGYAIGTEARLWALNRIQDRHANHLTITYQRDYASGDYRPSLIAYTGNSPAGIAPYNSIAFQYIDRTDIDVAYEGGAVIKTLKLLRKVTSYADTTKVREYHLAYDQSGLMGRSRLTSITECGTDGACLPGSSVNWWTGSNIAALQAPSKTSFQANFGSTAQWVQGDFNGDGLTDSFGWSGDDVTNIYLSNYDGNVVTAPAGLAGWGSGAVFWGGDFNGDGKTDLMMIRQGDDKYVLYTNNGIGGDGSFSFTSSGYLPDMAYGNTARWAIADYNGDGKADLRMWRPDGPLAIYLSQGDGQSFVKVVNGAWAWGDSANLYEGDFNGDGKADLMMIRQSDDKYVLYTNTSTSVSNVGFDSSGYLSDMAYGTTARWAVADYNGDGKADLRMWRPDGHLSVYLSRGNATFEHLVGAGGWNWGETADFYEGDFNGDGKMDLYMVQAQTDAHVIYINNGISAGTISFASSGYLPDMVNHSTARWAIGDFNGDGKSDVWGWRYADGTSVYYRYYYRELSDLLKNVVNGFGATTNITYKPLADNSVYTKDSNAGYLYQDVQNATQIVSSVSTTNGIGGYNTTTYQYGGLKKHLTADVSLGFRWVKATDNTSGIIHVTYHNQNREAGVDGTVAATETYANGVRVKYASNIWNTAGTSCGGTVGTNQPRLASSYEETRELNNSLVTSLTTSTTYDNCGYPTTIVATANDGWKKTVTNTYIHDTSNWILGQITRAQVTAEVPGQAPQTRTSSFAYVNGLLTSETIEPDNASLALTTSYAYDTFGNRVSKTLSGQGIQTRTESQIYGWGGRFVQSRTNALGHGSTFDYDLRNGQPIRQTDPNGLTATADYDGFGRKRIETRPDGTVTTISYEATSTGYSTVVQSSGTAPVYTYFDILGREIRSATNGFGGAWIYKTKLYDTLGRVIRITHPSFEPLSLVGTTYEYDILGRVKKVTGPGTGDRTTSTNYSGLTTTVTNPLGQTKIIVKNSQGRPVQVTDAAGTTYHQHEPFGDLSRVTDPLGNVTTMQYDIRGRKIGMHDPDMGDWAYQYNVLGELTSQTDAKNQTTTMAYDLLGRLRIRTAPEGPSTWTYDTAPNGIGKLASVSGPEGYQEQRTYDPLSRPEHVHTSIAGQAYTVTTNYDPNFGRLDTITYPSGFKVRQVYDSYGHLFQVVRVQSSGAQSLLWQTDAADENSRVIQETFSNGVIGRRVYDPVTNDLMAILAGNGGNDRNIQNHTYTFDAIDNLLTRADAITGLSETFSYDSLNRLTVATGAVTKSYQYDAIGNITSKSDVGTYTYNTSGPNSVRPHAVTAVAGVLNHSYVYDANGNMTTGAGRSITHTSFNKPRTINISGQTTTFGYDAGYNRIQKVTSTSTTTYVGKLYERVTTGTLVEHKNYIYGGRSLVATYTERNNGTPAETRHLHTDHLDSINVVTDENGTVVQRLSYDPHGKRRQPNGQDGSGTISSVNRGFTRHEHDDEVGLINMNARLYDPVLGRFIMPDTIVESSFGQGLNRYTYVRNNSLSYSDPTGRRSWKKSIKKLFREVKEELGQVKYVGGLLSTGFLSNPMFGPHYGAATGDWRSVGHAIATSAVLASSVYAGMLASEAYSKPILLDALGTCYSGASLSPMEYLGANALIAFDTGFSLAKINGASTRNAWREGINSAKGSLPFTLLDIAAIDMRADTIRQSRLNPQNASGQSAGYRGDGFKAGGGRWVEGLPAEAQGISPLGGRQGGQGSLFGFSYSPGSLADLVVEAFGGVHDPLNSWYWYNEMGNAINHQGAAMWFGEGLNAVNVLVAAPIVAGSVLAPYSSILDQVK